MQKILILKGLPASGKSTFAKQLCEDDPRWKRVNKDDLRAMVGCKHTKGNENFVKGVRNAFIHEALMYGYNVVVDDTNFHPSHEVDIRYIASLYKGTDVEIMEFAASIEECIERDAQRIGSAHVGEEVIRRMARDREQWRLSPPV